MRSEDRHDGDNSIESEIDAGEEEEYIYYDDHEDGVLASIITLTDVGVLMAFNQSSLITSALLNNGTSTSPDTKPCDSWWDLLET